MIAFVSKYNAPLYVVLFGFFISFNTYSMLSDSQEITKKNKEVKYNPTNTNLKNIPFLSSCLGLISQLPTTTAQKVLGCFDKCVNPLEDFMKCFDACKNNITMPDDGFQNYNIADSMTFILALGARTTIAALTFFTLYYKKDYCSPQKNKNTALDTKQHEEKNNNFTLD